MKCPNCGVTSAGKHDFCPSCGAYLKDSGGLNAVKPRPSAPVNTVPEPEPMRGETGATALTVPHTRTFSRALTRSRRFPAYAGVVIFMAMWLLAILIGFGAAGVIQGLQDRDESAIASSAEHKEKAKGYLQQGNFELAIVELTEARRLNPTDPEIATMIALLQTPVPATPSPTPTASPTVSKVTQDDSLSKTYADARKAYDARDYESVIITLEGLRRTDANYRKNDVDDLLYTSYVAVAHQYLNDKRFEEAVQKFDKALAMRKSDSLLGERNLASNFSRGMSARGADWARAVEAFAAVVRVEPKYFDAYSYLYEARVQYADVLVARNSPCQAAEQYAAAIIMGVTSELQSKQAAASADCSALASGTPAGHSTPGGSRTPAAPAGSKFAVSVQPGYVATGDPEASIRGRVVNRQGTPLVGVELTLFNSANYRTFATTGVDGGYTFDGLSPGNYGVRMSDDPASTSPLVYVGAKQRALINFSGN